MRKAVRAWIPIALLSAAVFSITPAHAQRDLKIGVVNFPLLVQQSPQFQQMTTALETEFAPRQRELLTQQQELETKQQTFERDASVMGEQERLDLERQIRDAARDLQRAGNEFREDLDVRRNEEMNKVQRVVFEQVQAYARSEGYHLVVAEAVYFDSRLDITEAVLKALQD